MLDVFGLKVAVLGTGVTGKKVTTFLLEKGAFVTVYDEREISDDTKGFFDSLGVEYFEKVDFDSLYLKENLVVKSPGIPWKKGILKAVERGIPVVDEMEVAGWYISFPIIGITGTNGKSTTVVLLKKILESAGFEVFLGGNYGEPLVEAVDKPYDVAVVEVSSFQLMGLVDFPFWLSGILNIAPDHIGWHGSFDKYVEAKLKMVERTGDFGECWVNVDDPVIASISWKKYGGKVRFYSTGGKKADLIVKDGFIYKSDQKLFRVPKSVTFPENVLMVISIALSWGVNNDIILNEIETFKGLPHRLEIFFEKDGVVFINDSKSTNPSSLLKALSRFPPEKSIILVGGDSKDSGYEILRDPLSSALHIVFFGIDGKKLKEIINPSSLSLYDSLAEAISSLPELIEQKKPEFVLFSPACASFDEFRNFKERGNFFKEEVRKIYE